MVVLRHWTEALDLLLDLFLDLLLDLLWCGRPSDQAELLIRSLLLKVRNAFNLKSC